MTFALLLALAAPQDEAAPQPWFVDVAASALPGVSTTCGSPAKDWIVEVNGGGLALADFDGDGHLDLVVVDGSTLARVAGGAPGLPPRLFLGDGACGFAPAGPPWEMAGGRWGMGAAVGDVNGDGWPDLLVTQWGAPRLFLNGAGAGFVETPTGVAEEGWSTSAAFLDYDGDGRLDLFLTRYLEFAPADAPRRGANGAVWKGHAVMAGPQGFAPEGDRLWRGKGDGTFEDVTARAGLDAATPAYGLGVVTLDHDGDGDTDLYVANDSMPNHLWDNRGDGTFREVGLERGVSHDGDGREQAGMGIACADVSGDGRPDLLVTNFSGEVNAFYTSAARGAGFRESATRAGLAGPSLHRLGWGTDFVDVDFDGDLDLFVFNGHVYPEADRPGTDTTYAQADQLFLRVGQRFVARPFFAGAPRPSRAAVAGDLDGDGDLDIVALAVEGPLRVLRNEAPRRGRWLCVDVAGAGALGARVTLTAEGRAIVREVSTAGGFQAARPRAVHFGLGALAGPVRLEVRRTDGRVQVLEDVALDRRVVVEAQR
jgi:hypothetical protein